MNNKEIFRRHSSKSATNLIEWAVKTILLIVVFVMTTSCQQKASVLPKGMDFVRVNGGVFVMGSPDSEVGRSDDESPLRTVNIRPFYIMSTHVTQSMWTTIMGTTVAEQRDIVSRFLPLKGIGEFYPMYYVSWEEAQYFVRKLNALDPGKGYRLPTEAEWEYACRAGTDTPFHFGETINTDQANYRSDLTYGEHGKPGLVRGGPMPVAHYPPNQIGLYDMHGNMQEWVEDWYHESYERAPRDGSARTDKVSFARVVRGGSWINDPKFLRSAARLKQAPGASNHYTSFRVVRTK